MPGLGRPLWRPPYPATWARKHGRGHVFYTSMGHWEEVWTGEIFQQIVMGGLAWAVGNVDADVAPNIGHVTPKAGQLRSPGARKGNDLP